MSPSHSAKGKESGTARVLGSGASGELPPVTARTSPLTDLQVLPSCWYSTQWTQLPSDL